MMTDAPTTRRSMPVPEGGPALTWAELLPSLLDRAAPLFRAWRELIDAAQAAEKNPRRLMPVQRAQSAYDGAVQAIVGAWLAYYGDTLPASTYAREAFMRDLTNRVRGGIWRFAASGLTGAEYVAQQQAKQNQAAPATPAAAETPAVTPRHYVVVGTDVHGAPEQIAIFSVTGEGCTVGAWASSPTFTLIGGAGWDGNLGDGGERYDNAATADNVMRVAAEGYLSLAREHAMGSGRYATAEQVEAEYYLDVRVPDPDSPSGWATVAGGPAVTSERHYTVIGTDERGAREAIGTFVVTDAVAGYTSSPTFTRGGARWTGNIGTGPDVYGSHAAANGAVRDAAMAYLHKAREHAATTGRYAGPEQIAAAYYVEVHVQDTAAPGRFVRLGGPYEGAPLATAAG